MFKINWPLIRPIFSYKGEKMNEYLQDLKAGGRPMTKKEIENKVLKERTNRKVRKDKNK